MSNPFLPPAPRRTFGSGCAIAAGLLCVVGSPATMLAAPSATTTRAVLPAAGNFSTSLRAGEALTFALPPRATFRVEVGAQQVLCLANGDTLRVQGVMVGAARVRVQVPGQGARVLNLKVLGRADAASTSRAIDAGEGFGAQPFSPATSSPLPPLPLPPLPYSLATGTTTSIVTRRGSRQIVDAPARGRIASIAVPLQPAPTRNATPRPAPLQIAPISRVPLQPSPLQPSPLQPLPIRLAPLGKTPLQRVQPTPLQVAPLQNSLQSTPRRAASVPAVPPAPRRVASTQRVPSAPVPRRFAQIPPAGSTSPSFSPIAPGAGAQSAGSGQPSQILPPPATGSPSGGVGTVPNTLPAPNGAAGVPANTSPSADSTSGTRAPSVSTPAATFPQPAASGVRIAPTRPLANRSTTPTRPATNPARAPQPRGSVVRQLSQAPASNLARSGGAQISPILPAPARGPRAAVGYRTTPRLPSNIGGTTPRGTVQVRAGLARLLSFPDNILSVFFSDPGVMDARAINARTIAVTGVGAGQSTLAVFTAQFAGDVVGKANIYRIATAPRAGAAPTPSRDVPTLERAIRSALNDPRVRVSVYRLPDGTLAARLLGTLRNVAEVQGAVTTASFFAPRVLSSLYADPSASTIDSVLDPSAPGDPDPVLQANLRRITGNKSIELIPLPSGLGLKAEVASPAEAEALLRVLPSLNQAVVPFIVIRGSATPDQNPYYNSQIPVLQGEDLQLTQKLQSVTGLRSVYAVRVSSNSIAIYGAVGTRGEYDTVRRYGFIVAQSASPSPIVNTSQGGSVLRPQGGEPPPLPSYDPVGGYARQLGVQMFVRITDPTQATIRNVTIETSLVEITRTALKDLGVQYGSATVLTESLNAGRAPSGTDPGVPASIQRTIDPAFRGGVLTGGNGFGGFGGFGVIDPIRARLSAISQRGDARILSNPSVRSVEGMPAQITIGGERPVPAAVATNGAAGQSVEFRRYGVIITMRPTVTDDNTIILQIRADVTQPDRTFEISLNGALIPGETVRSIDTTVTVRAGDVLVMGGLITNDKRQSTSKVPILGDLPIIGSLFRSKRFENNETELAIFMTPRLDFTPATLEGLETFRAAPGFPSLPSRQESNAILFQNNVR